MKDWLKKLKKISIETALLLAALSFPINFVWFGFYAINYSNRHSTHIISSFLRNFTETTDPFSKNLVDYLYAIDMMTIASVWAHTFIGIAMISALYFMVRLILVSIKASAISTKHNTIPLTPKL